MFWHQWPFSGTVWNLNPKFDTEILKFILKKKLNVRGELWAQIQILRTKTNLNSIFNLRKKVLWILMKNWFEATFNQLFDTLSAISAPLESRNWSKSKLLAKIEKFQIFQKVFRPARRVREAFRLRAVYSSAAQPPCRDPGEGGWAGRWVVGVPQEGSPGCC